MIYCVDDDVTIRDIEVYTLEQTGFSAVGFADGKSLFKALENEIPELIVLDIMLPETDGIEILKRLRSDAKYKDIPVIMATAKGEQMDKISGLNLGADDYLVKPFGVMEMVARINAVLRRTSKKEDAVITVGDINLNEAEHTVYINDKNIDLTHKEFDILRLFMKNKNIVFSREKLMNEVWGCDYMGESRTVDMHIRTLRQKLGTAGSQIKTVIGVGYRLESEK
ncbi:MAG: response regulator transcription factor [Acutalibacteraceae bacterium]|nr:response regulator transcription factor [Acutalibacteraceae bacterium]